MAVQVSLGHWFWWLFSSSRLPGWGDFWLRDLSKVRGSETSHVQWSHQRINKGLARLDKENIVFTCGYIYYAGRVNQSAVFTKRRNVVASTSTWTFPTSNSRFAPIKILAMWSSYRGLSFYQAFSYLGLPTFHNIRIFFTMSFCVSETLYARNGFPRWLYVFM